jgi:aryl-alcohol dehydrogenase-like predicted oxidoreductase
MEYLTVGEPPGRVLRLSRLVMGTDHLGKVPRAQGLAVLDEAVRLGINAFDTAPIYANGIEETLGRWLAAQPRQDLHVITKGGFPRDLGPGTYRSRLRGDRATVVANVKEELDGSRSRYDRPIAIYLMHRDDVDFDDYRRVARPQTPAATILEALSDPTLTQHYGMIGLSNWSTARVAEARAAARANPALLRPVCHSPYFSLFEMGPVTIHSGGEQVTHDEMMDPGFQPGVRLMTYSPLGGFSIVRRGWEAARLDALALKQAKERYWGHVHDAVFTPANAARYRHAEAFLKRFNARHRSAYTLDQLVDAYALAHPRSEFVVIGPRTLEQLRRTVASLTLARLLTRADLDALHAARELQGRAASPSQWPAPRRAAAGRASGGDAYSQPRS